MRKNRLSKSKQGRLIEHFVAGTTARCSAGLVNINFKSAVYYYHRLRMLICLATENESAFTGEIKVDESYFGGHRKSKRGTGAAGKVPVFGILKRGVKEYTKTITDTKAKTLMV
jgi:transposase